MPVTAQDTTINEEGQDKPAFVVSFTNGAKQQIEELQSFIETDDPLNVIKLGISFVQRLKELEEKKAKGADSESNS